MMHEITVKILGISGSFVSIRPITGEGAAAIINTGSSDVADDIRKNIGKTMDLQIDNGVINSTKHRKPLELCPEQEL